jgi:uncharacterized protein YbjT (DUF2867 family)
VTARVLVTGATGTTGRRLAARLVAAGAAVTAASRSGTAPPGTTGVRFDWYDPASYPSALAGVSAVYLIPPVPDREPERVMVPFLDHAVAAGVTRAVLHSSSVAAPGGPGTGAVHAAIAATFAEWAALRPGWFMQNVTGDHPQAQGIRATGALMTAAGAGRAAFIDAGDIAAVAAVALLRPEPLNADPVLTGPRALSFDEAAAILSEASGHPVSHRSLEPAELVAAYQAIGLPAARAEFMALIDRVIASGFEDRVTDAVERVTGQPPRSYEEFARAEFRL